MQRTFAHLVCSLAAAFFLAGHVRAQSGTALVFDGVNDFANLPLFATNAPTNEITIEFWQNVAQAKVQATIGVVPDNLTNRICGHVPWIDGVVYWDFGNINTAGRLAYTPPNPITNSWQHFAFVASSNGNFMRIYRNGVLEAQKTGMTPLARSTNDLALGQIGGGFFAGQMDEFRIWNVARGSNEIATNFMRSLVGNEAGLLVYLRCNDGAGTGAVDSAPLGGNTVAFLSNGVAWAASGASVGGLFVTMADALLVDTNNNGKVNSGDTLRYTVTIQNNGTNTLTNLVLNVPANPNTTLVPGSVKAPPRANDDGPATNSVPGNSFHVALNTVFNLSAPGLLANDNLGAPVGSIASFGGGSFPGTATTTAAGSSANNPAVGTLTVNANGSVTFTPTAAFNGLAIFQYRLTNAQGASIATASVAVGVRPTPVDDTLFVAGNTLFDSSLVPFSLMSNDAGDLTGVSSVVNPSLGVFTMNANGQFLFTPNVGASGSANVNYTITNGFGSAQAQVAVTVGAPVWYIDGASVAGTADGRSHTPFKTLTAFNTVNNGTAGNPGDNQAILLRDGTYAEGIVLRNGQRLIGEGTSGSLTNTLGVALPPGSVVAPGVVIPGFSGVAPLVAPAGSNAVQLASGNRVRGLTAGDTPAGSGFSGNSVGNLFISECSKIGSGGVASLVQGSGAVSVVFQTVQSTNGSVTLTGLAGSFSVNNGFLQNGIFAISQGNADITFPGYISRAGGSIIAIYDRTGGTVTFSGPLTNNSSGVGIQIAGNSGGAINFTGTSKVLNTAGNIALSLTNNGATAITFSNGGLDLDTTTAIGVNLAGVNNLTISGAGNSITTGSGTAFYSSGGNGTVDINAPLTGTGRLIDIQGRTGGSVTLSGNLLNNPGTGMLIQGNTGGTITLSGTTKTFNTGANTAVNLVNNTGATINFTGGGLAITTTTTGFNATGGATAINVTGTGNTINAGTATALNVVSTTIGASGLTFQSISSSGGSATGIILDSTGAGGGLTVTGSGSASSGGTIANKTGSDGAFTTGNGIYLNSAANVRLARMQLNDFANSAIRGFSVTGFTLRDSVISGVVGTSTGEIEGAIAFGHVGPTFQNGLFGNSLIDNVNISGSIEHQIEVYNQSGTMHLTITNANIHDNSVAGGSDGIQMEFRGTAQVFTKIDGCSFSNNKSQAIQIGSLETANVHATIRRNTITRGTQGNEGIVLSNGGDSDFTALIGGPTAADGNTISGFGGVAIFVGQVPGQGTPASLLQATIQNNNVTTPPTASNHGIIAFLSSLSGQISQARLLIDANTVTYQSAAARAILVDAPDASRTPEFHATVRNNLVTASDINAVTMISVAARNGAIGHSDIRDNDVNYTGGASVSGVNVREATLGSNVLARGGSASNDAATVIAANNPLSTTAVLPSSADIPVVENNTILLPTTPTLPTLP